MNYLLNELVDILEKESNAAKSDQEISSPSENMGNGPKNAQPNGVKKEPLVTWVHKNFQVILPLCFMWLLYKQVSFFRNPSTKTRAR